MSAFILMQFVPVSRTNPPVQWDSPQTQALATAACLDCHRNETRWPWYSYIAPSSWLQASHVAAARQQWNLSELNNLESFRRQRLAQDIAQQIRSGMMPPKDYLLLHPDTRLTDEQKAQLIAGFQKVLAT